MQDKRRLECYMLTRYVVKDDAMTSRSALLRGDKNANFVLGFLQGCMPIRNALAVVSFLVQTSACVARNGLRTLRIDPNQTGRALEVTGFVRHKGSYTVHPFHRCALVSPQNLLL